MTYFIFSKNVNIITKHDRSMGYGFVTFASEDEARKAVDMMNKQELDGRVVNIELADDSRKSSSGPRSSTRGRRGARRGNSRGSFSGPRTDRRSSFSGSAEAKSGNGSESRDSLPAGEKSTTSLFIGNMPWKFDEEAIKNLFTGLSVANVRVIRRYNGLSKGFGFVEFVSHEDQQKALKNFSDVEIEGRKLLVRVAVGQAKEAGIESESAVSL